MFATLLTQEDAASALQAAGFAAEPSMLHVERRWERWLVRLPDNRIAWVAASPIGVERLAAEAAVLRSLEARCSFAAPRVLLATADRSVQVRSMVEGGVDAARITYERALVDAMFARRIGTQVAHILAEQHLRVRAEDVLGVRRRAPKPPPVPDLRRRLSCVLRDVDGGAALLADIEALFAKYEAMHVVDADRVLVHGDVGFHNLVFDPDGGVIGIFDYEGAAWDDRHLDFPYLLFAIDHDEMLEAAADTYESLTEIHLDRGRIVLYNAMAAVSYLAGRKGVAPEAVWCGRNLAEDLQWTRASVGRVLNGNRGR